MTVFSIIWAVIMFIIAIILLICSFLVLKGYHIFMIKPQRSMKQQRNFKIYYTICYFLLVLFFVSSGIFILIYKNNYLGIWISITIALVGVIVGFIFFNYILSNDSDDYL